MPNDKAPAAESEVVPTENSTVASPFASEPPVEQAPEAAPKAAVEAPKVAPEPPAHRRGKSIQPGMTKFPETADVHEKREIPGEVVHPNGNVVRTF